MTPAPSASSHPAERRTAPRYRDNSPVYVGDGALARKCSLVDISEGGARILIGRGMALPGRIVIVDPRTGYSHLGAVVWRSETEIGVKFLGEGVRYRVMTSTGHLDCRAA